MLRASLVAALALVGCDDEPLDLTPRRDGSSSMGGSGGSGMGGSGMGGSGQGGSGMGGSGQGGSGMGGSGMGGNGMGGSGGSGGDRPDPCLDPQPDEAFFVSEVLPALDRGCSNLDCHARDINLTDRRFQFWSFPNVRPDARTSEMVAESLAETVAFVEWCEIDESLLLLYPLNDQNGRPRHPTAGPTWFSDDEDYLLVRDWLFDAIAPPPPPDMGPPDEGVLPDMGIDPDDGVEPPPPPSDLVPCDAIPAGDPLERPGYFEQFALEINPMLAGRPDDELPGGSCSEADCHGTGGVAGRLYLRPAGQPCSVEWNFMSTALFIDSRSPIQSPLLTKPLSPGHGGREVFAGNADPRYVLLRRWVESGIQ